MQGTIPEEYTWIAALAFIVGAAAILIGKDLFHRVMLKKVAGVLNKYPTSNSALDISYVEIYSTIHACCVLFGKEIPVHVYVRPEYKRKLINDLFVLNISWCWTSLLMPFVILISVVEYNKNVFRSAA